MNKKWIIYIIIAIIVSIIIGFSVYNFLSNDNEELQGTDMVGETELAENSKKDNIANKVNTIETSASEENISPNCNNYKKRIF